MRIVILDSAAAVASAAAEHVIVSLGLASSERAKRGAVVLGLATGGTPLGLYREWIERFQQGRISFANVTSFNLDEYIGLSPDDAQSYHYYMREYLFQHVDIDMNRTHVPQTHEVDLAASAARYDAAIEQSGGIDLQILGIGVDGHIGFNEVGSSLASRTRVKSLSEQTRRDNARYFDCLDSVPPMAITMGIGTIMEAREIVLLATGDNKARIIREAIEGPITASVPASVLQWHPNVTIFLDDSAAVQLQHRSYYMVSEANRMRLMGSKS